jgi:hypothetical protein
VQGLVVYDKFAKATAPVPATLVQDAGGDISKLTIEINFSASRALLRGPSTGQFGGTSILSLFSKPSVPRAIGNTEPSPAKRARLAIADGSPYSPDAFDAAEDESSVSEPEDTRDEGEAESAAAAVAADFVPPPPPSK